VIDGEAVLLGVDGRSDFNGLHSRQHDDEVQFYAFDMLVSDGDDIRKLPLSMRKTSLARLLARRVDGIFLSDFEQGEIGPELFRHACLMGLEGLVSKRAEGANDFLTKPVASNVILEAIERALAHHKFTRGLRSERDIVQARLAALTPREREVFELVIRGNTNKQIGRALSCTERTVKAHRHKVMEKMQI
jgi:DNA-binding CsgD family transcriptional regulator